MTRVTAVTGSDAPREGLPVFVLHHALFDGRVASMVDGHLHPKKEFFYEGRYLVAGGLQVMPHDNDTGPMVKRSQRIDLYQGGDLTEAEAAWEKAEAWVRTGVMP